MGDDLAIRFGAEVGTALGELLFQFEVIFNDAVVDDDDIASAMRMGIGTITRSNNCGKKAYFSLLIAHLLENNDLRPI